MKILVLTSIRSEYDLLSPLLFKLKADDDIELKLLVGGAHNSTSFGYTITDIKQDGFDILLQIESLLDADSTSSRLKSASILLISAIDVVKSYEPDLIIYAGDREEVMIGALLGGYLSIPTAHFYGGDHAADGHIDNPIRHAVSKLSTCHFVCTEEHQQRLLSIGEPAHRIFTIGSIALDKFHTFNVIDNINSLVAGVKVTKPSAILIYHPIEEERGQINEIVDAMVCSLNSAGFHCFIGLPNSDPGNADIRNALQGVVKQYDDVTLYGNLSRDYFLSLFKSSSIIVGNSSAGLLEAASLPIPCVNVGARQRGRFCGDNVTFVDTGSDMIKEGIMNATSDEYVSSIENMINPYGTGDSAQKAYYLIKSIDFNSLRAKKEDPLTNG